jgi:hypothetical protein
MRKLFYIFLLASFLPACTVFKKSISKPVTVFVDTKPVMPGYSTLGAYVKYVGNVSDDRIAQGFMDNFLSEGRSTTNVTLVNDPATADFTLELISFDVSERSNSETISDPKSSYNGQSVMLNSVEVSATFKVINNKNKDKKLMSCSNSKIRTEKYKNNRDLGDLVTGTNKDHTKYHTKLLSDDICLNLAQDVGRRVWVPITRRIAKNLK